MKAIVLSRIVRAPFIKASYIYENHVGLIGSRIFTWWQLLWRWFHRNLGACSICSYLLLSFGPYSSLHLPSSSCAQVDTLYLSKPIQVPSSPWSFIWLCQLKLSPSSELFTLPLRSMCIYMKSSVNTILSGQGTCLLSLFLPLYS